LAAAVRVLLLMTIEVRLPVANEVTEDGITCSHQWIA
jgi:hypothetical protein